MRIFLSFLGVTAFTSLMFFMLERGQPDYQNPNTNHSLDEGNPHSETSSFSPAPYQASEARPSQRAAQQQVPQAAQSSETRKRPSLEVGTPNNRQVKSKNQFQELSDIEPDVTFRPSDLDSEASHQPTKSQKKALPAAGFLPQADSFQVQMYNQRPQEDDCSKEPCRPLGRDGVLISGLQFKLGKSNTPSEPSLNIGRWQDAKPLVFVDFNP